MAHKSWVDLIERARSQGECIEHALSALGDGDVKHGRALADHAWWQALENAIAEENPQHWVDDATQELIDTIEDAKTKWIECDWTHERRDSDPENPVYCEGGQSETCDYCADVQSSAESASSYGDEAIAALKRGDIGEALQAITSAEHLEDKWGDAPIWRPVLKLCEAAGKVSAADRDGDGEL
jgi:hypothetical protein